MTVRVLICDPASMTRTGLRRVLDDESGIKVVGEAGDGLAAVDAVRQLHPDVVLLDTALERTDGVETTQQVRDEHVSLVLVCHGDHRMAAAHDHRGVQRPHPAPGDHGDHGRTGEQDHRGPGTPDAAPGATVIFAAERPGTRSGVGP